MEKRVFLLAAFVFLVHADLGTKNDIIDGLVGNMVNDIAELNSLREDAPAKDHKEKSDETDTQESLFNINIRLSHIAQGVLDQGDVRLTPEQKAIQDADNNPNLTRDALKNPARRWPKQGGRVKIPIVLDAAINNNPRKRNAIKLAAEKFTEGTCIDFEETTQTNEHHIRIINDGGCYSYLGRVTNGPDNGFQPISIGDGCGFLGIVEHEMMHALGFYHEQARPDRDGFVRLQLQNLANPGFASQFAKQRAALVDTASENYDFDSIMHYDSSAFAKRGLLTIVKLNGDPIRGNRGGFSPSDLRGLNKIYECQDNPAPGPETPAPTTLPTVPTTLPTTPSPAPTAGSTPAPTNQPTTPPAPTDGPTDGGPDPGPAVVNCKAFAAIGLCEYSEVCSNCKVECAAAPAKTILNDRNPKCARYAKRGFCKSARAGTRRYMEIRCTKACLESQFPPDGCGQK